MANPESPGGFGSFFAKLTGSASNGISATGKYDLVAFDRADGTQQQMSGAAFEALPFDERIRVILSGKPRFWLAGKEVPRRDALKSA